MDRLQREYWRKHNVEAKTYQKFIGASPRKLRLVAGMVRKMEPKKALDILAITRKDAARQLFAAVNTAVSNAKQNGMDLEKIILSKIEINEGPKMKRFRAGTRGRAKPYVKKMSHIKIVLSDQGTGDSIKEVKKETE